MFGPLDCDRYIGDIVIPWIVNPGFCSIHYTITLAGLKNVNHYNGNIVLSKIVIFRFHRNKSDKAVPQPLLRAKQNCVPT